MKRFENKVAFVTGGANGIGKACVRRLAAEGATVIAADWKAGDLDRVVGESRDAGHKVSGIVTDVMDEAAIGRAFAHVDEVGGGRLDVSLHVAGNSVFGLVESLASSEWERLWRLNVLSTIVCCREAVARMKRGGGGAIVNMASISGLAGDPGWGAYNSAKAAVINLTQCLAWETGRYGIRANAICPGPIGTERMLGSLESDPKMRDIYNASTPLRRIGTPEECAGAILFLASDDAAFVNSTTLVCDGGLTGATGQPRFDLDSYSFDGGS